MNKFLFLIALFFISSFAKSEEQLKIIPYVFKDVFYFSERELVILDDYIVYKDTLEPFVVASGKKIKYSLIKFFEKAQCIGCKTIENTSKELLEKLKKIGEK